MYIVCLCPINGYRTTDNVFLLKCTSLSLLLTKFYCFVGRHVGSLGNRLKREGFLFMNILCVIH